VTALGGPGDDEIVAVLDHLGRDLDPSILIGGWATHQRVGGDISRDIDVIVVSDEVRSRLAEIISGLSSSTHLQGRKLRGQVDGVHVDVYLKWESVLGRELRLRVSVLAEHTEPTRVGGWLLLTIEAHTVSKLAALLDRPDTEKGEKDARELLRLIESGVDAESAVSILMAATERDHELIPGLLERAFRLIGEQAGANKQQRRALDMLRRQWVDAAGRPLSGPSPRPAI
jgi:hypothetical protein